MAIEYHDFGRGRNHRELIEILRNNGFETEVVHTILERLTMLVGARIGMILQTRSRLLVAIRGPT